jgi:hypothetical protein
VRPVTRDSAYELFLSVWRTQHAIVRDFAELLPADYQLVLVPRQVYFGANSRVCLLPNKCIFPDAAKTNELTVYCGHKEGQPYLPPVSISGLLMVSVAVKLAGIFRYWYT